jgi:arylsulfatase A-like enzyme
VVALAVALVLGLVVVAAVDRPAGTRPGSAARPNIVLIITDDQRVDELAGMPNVRSLLIDHGITFSNYFATTPSCCPSRSSLLAGQYSHHTGVLDGTAAPPPGGASAFHDTSTLATWLRADGYRTGLVGKYLNQYGMLPAGYIPPGWNEWDAIAQPIHEDDYYDYMLNENGKIVRYGDAPSDYSTTVLADKAMTFIRTSRQPFFLYFAPVAPHVPATPAPGDEARVPAVAPILAPSYNQADVSAEPWGTRVPPLRSGRQRKADEVRMGMYRSLLAVDRAVGDMVGALDSIGELNDTYILYTSDNGYLWGEHRIIGKLWPFEESIRVPLVVRVPGMDAPRTDPHLVLNIDMASTLTQLAGTRPGLPQDGRSFVPLLQGRSPPWRSAFVVEFLGSSSRLPPAFVALRTEQYMYVEFDNGWRDLYDVRADPFELHNLAEDPSARPVVSALATQLHTLFTAPASGTGQTAG